MPDPDIGRAEHLPKLRPSRQPAHPSWLPRQRRGTTPQMIGRYPDYDVLDTAGTWDEATRKVVLARLEPVGPLRFFTPAEEPALRAFCDTVLAQDTEPRVPVAEMVDAKLADGRLDGYQYADMPDDRDTWRLVLAGLDHTAAAGYQVDFARCTAAHREIIIGEFAQARLVGGAWEQLNVTRSWAVVMRATLATFYSHPWVWNEIGFGGPAYPRGFMRLGGP
ncbi:MAG: gluconate 2-dehydrogenase subunit 3 family protein, partial [Actinomycetota bacterium]|nr:gluconate 2-dehydrogenase subunit 3 family protein [Actinomycetota bacterium]